MEPTAREKKLQETAILYGYALVETNQRVPGKVADAANNHYCTTDFVSHLCDLIKSMDSDTRVRVVYNPYNKTSRQLADWWETHQEADRKREAAERKAAREKELFESAVSKLTPEEFAAIKAKLS